VHDGGEEANGAEFPGEVAATALKIPPEGQWFFSLGFDFGLELASAISSEPTLSPDLTLAIAKIAKDVAAAAKSTREHVLDAAGAAV
jgi:hypothetical protein